MASILFVLLQYWFLMTSYEVLTWVVGNILKASGWNTSFFQVYQKCDLSNSNGDLLLKRPRLLIVTVVTISVPLCYSTTLCVPMSLVGLSFTLYIPVCLVTHLPSNHSTNCPVPNCFTCNCFHSHSSTVSPLFIASLFCFELCTVEKEIVAKLPIFAPMVLCF